MKTIEANKAIAKERGPTVDTLWAVTAPNDDPTQLAEAIARDGGQKLWSLAQRHRVSALLNHRLGQHGLPPDKAFSQQQAARSLMIMAKLRELTDGFNALGLSFRLLKGLALAQRYYPHVAARHLGDIDLLIPPTQLAKVDQWLLAQGYVRPSFPLALTPAVLNTIIRSRHDLEYHHRQQPLRLEIHWRLVRNQGVLPLSPSLWQDTDHHVTIAGRDIATLPPDWHFLFLCAHGARHRWGRMMWLNDLRFMLASDTDSLTPAALRKLSHAIGGDHSLALGLSLLQRLNASRPSSETPATKPTRPQQALLRQCHQRLCATKDRVNRSLLEETVDEWRLLPSAKHWLRHYVLARMLATSERDLLSLPLPDRLHGLYPLLRPLLWAKRRLLKPPSGQRTPPHV